MANANKYATQKYHLLKAESLCAELLNNGVSFDELVIQFKGSFKKSYSNDIENVTETRDDTGAITIAVNRDGIYDRVPEGLFHQTRGGGNTATLQAMVGEYKRYREEERQARKFFQPLEQELFRYAVLAEENERRIRFGILNGNVGQAFYQFWNIDSGLPPGPASVLVLIMPWIRQIKGDMQLTAKALAMTLDKEVKVELKIMEEQLVQDNNFTLGNHASLSVDTVCGSQFNEPYEQWVFTISGLTPEEIDRYTAGDSYGKFLERFEELFIPLSVTAKFEYHYDRAVTEQAHEEILGYGFYL